MERRALIAVVISLFILVLYQEVVLRYLYPHPAREQAAREAAPLQPPPPPAAGRIEKPAPPVVPPLRVAAAPRPRPAPEGRHVTVETDLFTAVFTSSGARLESFRLKKYRTTVDPRSPLQETVVPGEGGELPFGVELRGTATRTDAGAPYTVSRESLQLQGDETGSIDFRWETEQGTVRKRFTFRGDRYEFVADISARNVPRDYKELGISWFKGTPARPKGSADVIFDRTVFLEGHKLKEDHFDKLADGKILTGDIRWAGYAGRYFLAAMIPAQAENYRLWLKLRDHTVEEKILFPITSQAVERHLDVYIGPKVFDALDGVGHGLSRAVNLGWFGFIALPLLHALNILYALTRNYGIAIILLTAVIKVIFLPLTQRSFRSMQAMQKLQPQMAKIRERFKDNSEQMNKEIMELYRRHKVNPLGGCLPMVLQVPVFIGLYEGLLNSVELRHAPFYLWINDLSAPDRLGSLQLPFVQHPGIPVLTLLMGVSMFVQQWMTPTAGDPTQQRVMMIMPLLFTFMFVNFPSGLALYWLVNNLLTIAQQYYMNRTTSR
ncbi:MAG: membrane protein insertase YidC [Candidatus Binatia bacterium]